MKATVKQIKKAKDKAKKIEKKQSDTRVTELEELVVLMGAKITSLEDEMKSMQNTYSKMRQRLGI